MRARSAHPIKIVLVSDSISIWFTIAKSHNLNALKPMILLHIQCVIAQAITDGILNVFGTQSMSNHSLGLYTDSLLICKSIRAEYSWQTMQISES